MCNRECLQNNQKRSGYTRLKILAYFSVCILTLGVFTEQPKRSGYTRLKILAYFSVCILTSGVFTEHQNDQEMDVRKLRFRHPLPGLGGV